MKTGVFPEGFVWGAATSACQIEGHTDADGGGRSVWDAFCEEPGRIVNDDTCAVACDHYNRWREDVALLRDLGVGAYRFSISWPRVMPNGTGAVNEKGVEFYSRLVDELLSAGITPHVTLFHWDTPQALQDRYGGWLSRRAAFDFAEYAGKMAGRLGDRVHDWITVNEIGNFTTLSFAVGQRARFAPGLEVESSKTVNQSVHHALLGHGLAVQAVRAASPGPCRVSIVHDTWNAVPVIETPENIAAAALAYRFMNGTIMSPVLEGRIEPSRLAAMKGSEPDSEPGDYKTISQPLDRFGLNVYTGHYVKAADNGNGYEFLALPQSYPRMNLNWLTFTPDGLYWGVRHISETMKKPDLDVIITENGCVAADRLDDAGRVNDMERVLYIREYLRAAGRAVSEGFPLRGYFHWSLLDNFEWAEGYSKRFGLVYTRFSDQRRIPKLSYGLYREAIRRNGPA